ncbi:MAG: Blue-light-activated protein [Syntrophorhabdus sp. PtaU1.Bin050]|nr:MAG: Blue-light-activated protein [Syntrophorhabdus sp. PtaU1.Bin050]
MSIRYVLAVFAVFIGLCGVLFTSFYEKAKQESIKNLNTQQLLHAKQAARGIESFFNNWTTILTVLSETDHIKDMDVTGKKNIESLYKNNNEFIRSIARVDARGRIIYTFPYDRNAVGRDISSQKHMREIMSTHQFAVSDVFPAVQGYNAIVLHVPVFKDKSYRGTIGIVVNFQSLAGRYLENIKIGKTGYAWLISRDGTELFCPIPGHVGNSVFENCKNFPSILAMAEDMLKRHEGVATYTFDKIRGDTVDVVKKHAVYMPITIGNTFWSIVVASSENEILSSLKGFRNKLLVIIGVLLLGGVLFSYYGLKAWLIVQEEKKRRRAEDELRASEERYRTIVENTNDAIYIHDFDGNIIDANENACKMVGYTRDELVGANLAKIDNTWLRPESPEFEQVMREEATAFEHENVRKEGTVVPVEISAKIVSSEGKGIVQVFARDISERKRMEEEIARERSKLQTLWDNAPFGMILIDADGRFGYINPKFTELFGFDLSDTPDGRTWFRRAYPNTEYRHTVISTWVEDWREAKPGTSMPRVFTATCKDGTQKTVNFITSALVSGGYLMACEDITELKDLESQLRQAQKMEAIGTLAGGIAHDFNNILTSLLGYASLIQMKMDTANPLKLYVDQILSATQKAADLVRSLLTFGRRQSVTLAPLDINNVIKTAQGLLKRLLTEDIELRTSLAQDGMIVMADKTQMDQILFNLVTNARDAMPKGGTLTVETGIVEIGREFVRIHGFGRPGRYVQIKISDTGMGMDEATRESIFDPFFTTKEVGKGTGLGLATVYGIVKQHNGYITVHSKLNQGSSFHIYLPEARAIVDQEKQQAVSVKRGNEKILVAEDNEEVRHFMREVLQQYGYKVIEAIDGEDAIERFKHHRGINLVIIDSVMPKRNGREVYEEMRGMQPRIKTLFTSGYTKDIVLDKGIEDGKFDFIAKPLSPATLLQKVREILDRQR